MEDELILANDVTVISQLQAELFTIDIYNSHYRSRNKIHCDKMVKWKGPLAER